jgi:tungstate transport system permease protein
MSDIGEAVGLAVGLMLNLDRGLVAIVLLSLRVSLSAVAIAALIGLPLGAALAVYDFRGRHAAVVFANSMLALPPVVVGLVGYLLLSRAGPLGALGLLFTPSGMILAQTMLTLPIIVALVHRAVQLQWERYGDQLQSDGAERWQTLPHLLQIARIQVMTAILAALGRAVSEVGAIIIVGGNIDGYTRTMTTTIVLETSKGNLPLALALGIVLLAISIAINGVALSAADPKRRT